MCSEAADDADPLRSRRARNLLLEHPHRIGERSHSIPAQLHVVVEPASDDVHMAVDQAGDDAPTIQVDASDIRRRSLKNVGIASDSNEPPIRNGNGSCTRILPVKGGNFPIEEDEISRVSRALRSTRSGLRAKGCRKGSQAEEQLAAISQTDHLGGSLVRRRFRQNGMVDFFGRIDNHQSGPSVHFLRRFYFVR